MDRQQATEINRHLQRAVNAMRRAWRPWSIPASSKAQAISASGGSARSGWRP